MPTIRPPLVNDRLPCSFFERPVLEVARDLLGCTFLFNGVGGRLVEVEAYRADDPASHSFRGRTARNAVMFGPPGRLYVYFTMGLHFCVNVVCEGEGRAAAVLLRALEPTAGLEIMRRRRGLQDPRRLCSGPANLTQALAITRDDDGLGACGDRHPDDGVRDCDDGVRDCTDGSGPGDGVAEGAVTVPVARDCTSDGAGHRTWFLARDGVEGRDPFAWSRRAPRIVATPRIGVSAGAETPWRFVDADSPFLSRPLPRAARR
jgi:DNA-3-methyladenine glycosylase